MSNARSTKGNPTPLTPELEAQIRALEAMPDSTIDLTDLDAPEVLDWSGAVRGRFYRPIKRQITLRIDADLLDWFQQHAPKGGYQTNINTALREYVPDRKRASAGK